MDIEIDGPTADDNGDHWWAPLEAVAALIKDDSRSREFDIRDFMVMCRYTQGGERIIEYKHIHTRRCIQLSEEGLKPYRYVPPGRRAREDDLGHYVADADLYAALDRLELPLGAEMKANLERWWQEHDEEVDRGDLHVL